MFMMKDIRPCGSLPKRETLVSPAPKRFDSGLDSLANGSTHFMLWWAVCVENWLCVMSFIRVLSLFAEEFAPDAAHGVFVK